MWVGIKGILGKQAGEADTGIATFRTQNGKMASSSNGKREVLVVEHYRKLRTHTAAKRSTQSSRRKSTRGESRTYIYASERADS